MARVLTHVPDPRRHVVHYYGAYSNVARGKRKKGAADLQATADEPEELSPAERERRRRWAEMIRRVYEVDPVVCPACGGEMPRGSPARGRSPSCARNPSCLPSSARSGRVRSDRDRREHAVDPVCPRPVEPFQELPGVGAEGLGATPMALGVEHVEGERRLAGPDDAGHRRDRAGRIGSRRDHLLRSSKTHHTPRACAVARSV